MTVTYKPGDRVVINWDNVTPSKIYEFELDHFVNGETYCGIVEDVDGPYLKIIWDEQYHSAMYGETGRQWNLHFSVLSYDKNFKELTQEEKILRRIKKTYSKSKLPFVKKWSN